MPLFARSRGVPRPSSNKHDLLVSEVLRQHQRWHATVEPVAVAQLPVTPPAKRPHAPVFCLHDRVAVAARHQDGPGEPKQRPLQPCKVRPISLVSKTQTPKGTVATCGHVAGICDHSGVALSGRCEGYRRAYGDERRRKTVLKAGSKPAASTLTKRPQGTSLIHQHRMAVPAGCHIPAGWREKNLAKILGRKALLFDEAPSDARGGLRTARAACEEAVTTA